MSNESTNETLAWIPSPCRPRILPGEVHLWRINLDAGNEAIQTTRSVLSTDETNRADRFRFDRDKRRFTMAHGAMRAILARYVEAEPQELVFDYSEKGKADLTPALNAQELKFNLSHSHEISLLAVTRRLSLGIDIEAVNCHFPSQEIAQRFFSVDEVRRLFALPEEQRTEAFYSCWTRKEAYIKALGEGLSIPLDSFSVAFEPNIPAALLRVERNPSEVNRWGVYDIEAHPGYKAALVAEAKDYEICRWDWANGC